MVKVSTKDDEKAAPLIKGRRATSYDVARLAGVSQSAVSRCFKPGASVSKRMRDRVMKAAEELAYRPNAIARGLITQRSNLVAVLVSGRLSLYYPEALFRLTEELSKAGMRALLFTVETEEEAGAAIDQAWQFQVDGLISASHMSRAQLDYIEKQNIPLVFFNRYFPERSNNVVYCDPTSQVDEVVSYLEKMGHQRFALITGPEDNMVSRVRCKIVRERIGSIAQASLFEAPGDFSYESGATALQDVFKSVSDRPTAIICVNDMMAMGCMDEARSVMGLSVPADLSIVGFDGIGMAQFASYELSTIRQPIGRMCEAAVSMIVAQVDSPDQSNEKRVFAGAWIEGRSIAPAR